MERERFFKTINTGINTGCSAGQWSVSSSRKSFKPGAGCLNDNRAARLLPYLVQEFLPGRFNMLVNAQIHVLR
jgi:hypothetical protein